MEMDEKYPLALPQGTILAGQYIIDHALGQGGFGITYKATDHKTGQKVAVKEFFPDSMATRTQTTVTAFSGERGESFAYGKSCFLQEAETLAEFIGNENIVKVHSYFEENGTAYFVMDFVEGTSFDQYIKEHGGRISYEEAEQILLPVMDALAAVHSRGIVHRDVTPDNIYITKDGTVKLLDFGAARYSLGDKSRSLDVVLKHGFAPKEQYTRHGKQGPFTDVYTVGASFYFAITGRRPPDSIDRLEEDDLIPPSSLGVAIPPAKEDALLQAMSVQASARFQTMGAFKQALLAGNSAANVLNTEPVAPVQPQPEQVQQRVFTTPVQPQTVVQPQPVVQPQTEVQPQPVVQPQVIVQPQPVTQAQPMVQPQTSEQLQQMAPAQPQPLARKIKQPQNVKKTVIGWWIGLISLLVGMSCMVAYAMWPTGRSEAVPVGVVLIVLGIIAMTVSKICDRHTAPSQPEQEQAEESGKKKRDWRDILLMIATLALAGIWIYYLKVLWYDGYLVRRGHIDYLALRVALFKIACGYLWVSWLTILLAKGRVYGGMLVGNIWAAGMEIWLSNGYIREYFYYLNRDNLYKILPAILMIGIVAMILYLIPRKKTVSLNWKKKLAVIVAYLLVIGISLF